MRRNSIPPITAALALCALLACERRSVPLVSDAATTGAPVVMTEQTIGDASMTSASLPIHESTPVTPEPTDAAADAGATEATEATATDAGQPMPRWVPKDATLSIIASGDRDRNLGIVKAEPAPTPAKLTVDAGGVAVEIEIVPR